MSRENECPYGTVGCCCAVAAHCLLTTTYSNSLLSSLVATDGLTRRSTTATDVGSGRAGVARCLRRQVGSATSIATWRSRGWRRLLTGLGVAAGREQRSRAPARYLNAD